MFGLDIIIKYSERRMALSEEVPCLDVVRRTLGNRHRNHAVSVRGSLQGFHRKRAVILLVVGGLGASSKSGSHLARREKATDGKDHRAVQTRDRSLQVCCPGDSKRCAGREVRVFLRVHGR